MKYFQHLSNLETQIIRLSEFENLYNLIVASTETGVTVSEIQTVLYTIQEMLEDITEKMGSEFQSLWQQVRQDSWNNTTEEKYDYEPLQEAMNRIIKNEHILS